MPQLKSSAKRLRQSKKRAAANKKIKDNINYLERQLKKTITAQDKPKSTELFAKLTKSIDKAAKKHIYHRNKAARKKSAIARATNQLKSNK